MHRVAIISSSLKLDTTSTECPTNFSLSIGLKRSLAGRNDYPLRDNGKPKLIGLRRTMLDLIFIAATVLFFLIAVAYVRGCEKLR